MLTTNPTTFESNSQKKVSIKEVEVVKPINKSKFEVYLAQSKIDKSLYAMKVYPYTENNDISGAFKRESRLSKLSHINIISVFDSHKERDSILHGKEIKVSYILLELAPYGDFADLLINSNFPRDNILARTFFHQLIEGVEYLHSKKIAHLDLKLENLLLGKGFYLKIADFDCCFTEGDTQITTRGTNNFRAPEIRDKKCRNPKAADIYSAGIILFALKSGVLPYIEDVIVKGNNLFDLVRAEDPSFFEIHNECRDSPIEYDKTFRNLFFGMVRSDVSKRMTISDIKKSEWYQGPIYSQKEVINIFTKKLKNMSTVLSKKP